MAESNEIKENETPSRIEKATQLAEKALEDIKKSDEAKKAKEDKIDPAKAETAEPKDAATESLPGKEKVEGDKPEAKVDNVSKRKAEIQAEIDQKLSEKKALEKELGEARAAAEELKRLREENATLKKPAEASIDAVSSEKERINKYVKEDAEKPREERREMAKEELDEWMYEDPSAAQEWIAERALRRRDEREQDKLRLEASKRAEEVFKKQEESKKKLFDRFPKSNPEARVKELMGLGKNKEEIHEILMGENEHYRAVIEIARSNPEKYLGSENGPELVMQEMEKKFAGKGEVKKPAGKFYTQEEVDKMLEDAQEKANLRASGVDEGLSGGGSPQQLKTKSKLEQQQERIARRAGMTLAEYKKAEAENLAKAGVGNDKD